MRRFDARDLAVWTLRVLWFALPVTFGGAVADLVGSSGDGVERTVTIGAWTAWGLGVLASAIPLPVSLTALRILAPAAAAAAAWAALDIRSAGAALALAHAVALAVVCLNQLVGDRFVDGASYGEERRMLLRVSVNLGLTVMPLTWLGVTTGIVAGPLLLADGRWWLGGVLTAVGLPVAAVGARALHQLSRRWVVFVPTGFVLHDLATLTEPVLFRRTSVERLGPALAGSPARDLSQNAPGLLLECELADPAPLGLRTAAGGATSTDVRRFLFSPSRPGELLDEARRRGLAVG